jgi:hypothetical protein
MSYARLAEKKSAQAASRPKATTGSVGGGLRIGNRNDIHEREADRVADAVSSDRRMTSWSLSKVNFAKVQRQTPNQPAPAPNNYQEAAGKLAETFLQTDIGKKLIDPLAKAGEDFIGTLPGKIIAGSAAVGAVSAMAATHSALPRRFLRYHWTRSSPVLA